MNSKTSRLFFALNPDEQTRSRMREIQSALMCEARPVPPANLHMTLVFLGQVEDSELPRLLELGDGVTFPGCKIKLNTVGRFKRAGVAWLGCEKVPGPLDGFQASLAQHVKSAGFAIDDRNWKAHVTLYRNLRKSFEIIEFEALNWLAGSFCLMQSRHDRSGVKYQVIGQWPAPN